MAHEKSQHKTIHADESRSRYKKKSHFMEHRESKMSRCVGKTLSFNFKKLKITALNHC